MIRATLGSKRYYINLRSHHFESGCTQEMSFMVEVESGLFHHPYMESDNIAIDPSEYDIIYEDESTNQEELEEF